MGKDQYEIETYHEKGAWEYRATCNDNLIYHRKRGDNAAVWESVQ